jgi:hypothetical protein
MATYTVTVTQYNCFEDIEADSEEEAKDIATNGCDWDSGPNFDMCLTAELQEEE